MQTKGALLYFLGLSPALRRSPLLPADTHDQGTRALEAGARAAANGAAVRLSGGPRHP